MAFFSCLYFDSINLSFEFDFGLIFINLFLDWKGFGSKISFYRNHNLSNRSSPSQNRDRFLRNRSKSLQYGSKSQSLKQRSHCNFINKARNETSIIAGIDCYVKKSKEICSIDEENTCIDNNSPNKKHKRRARVFHLSSCEAAATTELQLI